MQPPFIFFFLNVTSFTNCLVNPGNLLGEEQGSACLQSQGVPVNTIKETLIHLGGDWGQPDKGKNGASTEAQGNWSGQEGWNRGKSIFIHFPIHHSFTQQLLLLLF